MVASGVSLDRSYFQQQNKHNHVKKKKKPWWNFTWAPIKKTWVLTLLSVLDDNILRMQSIHWRMKYVLYNFLPLKSQTKCFCS